jgi:D-arabinose 1-dehydrogenase-like Zn-dependent alcohol dehydrogenase
LVGYSILVGRDRGRAKQTATKGIRIIDIRSVMSSTSGPTSASGASLPTRMQAFVLEEFGKPYVLRDVPLPQIEHPHDVLIRVDAGSYCHTDAVMAAGTMHPPTLPHIGCHEYAGTVVALAPDRLKPDSHGLKVGDRVAVSGRGYHVCGECLECRNPSGPVPDEPGFSVYCPYTHGGLGVHGPGGFSEYSIVDSKQVQRIPDGLTAVEVAPLMCAGLTVYAALVKCELKPGQRVGIIGCGVSVVPSVVAFSLLI